MDNQNDIFSNYVDDNKYLYHYTKLDTALEKILYSAQLRLSLFFNSNDPRENKEWTNIALGVGLDCKRLFDSQIRMKKIIEKIQQSSKIICFSRDETSTVNSKKIYGRGYFRARMWDQYANKHTGVCLMFNREKLTQYLKRELDTKGFLKWDVVNYCDNPRAFSSALASECDEISNLTDDEILKYYFDQYSSLYFFTKNYDWKQECEYRYVFLNTKYNDDSGLFFFRDSLEAIICGEDLHKVYIPLLKERSLHYNCQLAQIETHNGVPRVEKIYNNN